MDFEVKRTIHVDIEEVAKALECYLSDAMVGDLNYDYNDYTEMNRDKLLKAVGKYWFENL